MTQILPANDVFGHGSPAYGAFVTMYLQARPTTGTISSIWNPNGVSFISRPIHGGYQTVTSYGIHDYNAAFHNAGSNTRAPSGTLFRRPPSSADVLITGTFEMRALLGTPVPGDLAPRGVIARAQAGTLVGDGTADAGFDNLTCYLAALYQKNGDNTLRLGIYRFNAGSPSTMTLMGSESVALTNLGITKLATVTLQVLGSGASVSLIATCSGVASGSVSTSDTSGSRITSSGRFGFVMGSDRELVAGRRVVDLCHLLACDVTGGREVQDEFRRLSLGAAKQLAADVHGIVGNYVSSAYYWDAATFDGSFASGGKTYTGSKRLRRNAAGGTVDFDHQTTDDDVNSGRLILSQRPADNIFSQHRSVSVNIPTAPVATAGEVWAGIILRASQAQPLDESTPTQPTSSNPNFPGNGTPGTGGTGYIFTCRAKTSTHVIWQLHRIVNNAHVPVARLAETPTFSVFPGYNVAFTMELDVHPLTEADPTGTVRVVCKVNGVEVVFTQFLAPGGWTMPDDGTFLDASSSRIKQGFGEGLVVANGLAISGGSTANNIDPLFASWMQETLTNAAVIDQDQPSVEVDGNEGTPSGVDLSTILGPDWPFESELETWELSNPFESGHRQTIPRFTKVSDGTVKKRSSWIFRSSAVELATMNALLDFFDEHNNVDGAQVPFNFTPPGEAQQACAFKRDSLRHKVLARGPAKTVFEAEFEVVSLL